MSGVLPTSDRLNYREHRLVCLSVGSIADESEDALELPCCSCCVDFVGSRDGRLSLHGQSFGGGYTVTPALFLQRNSHGRAWKIILYATDDAAAKHAADAAYARIEQLNRVLSDYDPTSELSKLSDTAPSAAPVAVSDDLWNVLSFSKRLSEASGGAFDITVGPLTKLWRRARRTKEMPDADLLKECARRQIIGRCDWMRHITRRS